MLNIEMAPWVHEKSVYLTLFSFSFKRKVCLHGDKLWILGYTAITTQILTYESLNLIFFFLINDVSYDISDQNKLNRVRGGPPSWPRRQVKHNG